MRVASSLDVQGKLFRASLEGLNQFAQKPEFQALPPRLRAFRSNPLRETLERRQAALFCYGLSEVTGIDIGIAHLEQSDYDFIMAYHEGGNLCFCPLQMKEFVPATINPQADLQAEFDKLAKYTDSEELVVAMHLNRRFHFDYQKYDFSRLPIKELWLFGQTGPGKPWVIMGNMMDSNPTARFFNPP